MVTTTKNPEKRREIKGEMLEAAESVEAVFRFFIGRNFSSETARVLTTETLELARRRADLRHTIQDHQSIKIYGSMLRPGMLITEGNMAGQVVASICPLEGHSSHIQVTYVSGMVSNENIINYITVQARDYKPHIMPALEEES